MGVGVGVGVGVGLVTSSLSSESGDSSVSRLAPSLSSLSMALEELLEFSNPDFCSGPHDIRHQLMKINRIILIITLKPPGS